MAWRWRGRKEEEAKDHRFMALRRRLGFEVPPGPEPIPDSGLA